MNKGTIGALVILAVVLVGGFAAFYYFGKGKQTTHPDYMQATYLIEGKQVTLEKLPEPGTSVPDPYGEHTYFFGNTLKTDLNGDGVPDLAFIVVWKGGGTGSFFYVVGAVQQADGGYVGSDGYPLGDRIAPQTINESQNPAQKNVIVVNYADRALGDPMTARPSFGKSVYLKLDSNSRWGIVEPNFSGESR